MNAENILIYGLAQAMRNNKQYSLNLKQEENYCVLNLNDTKIFEPSQIIRGQLIQNDDIISYIFNSEDAGNYIPATINDVIIGLDNTNLINKFVIQRMDFLSLSGDDVAQLMESGKPYTTNLIELVKYQKEYFDCEITPGTYRIYVYTDNNKIFSGKREIIRPTDMTFTI